MKHRLILLLLGLFSAFGAQAQVFLKDSSGSVYIKSGTSAYRNISSGITTSASSLTTGTLPDARLSNTGTTGTYGSSTAIPVITTDAKGRVTGVTTTTFTTGAELFVDSTQFTGAGTNASPLNIRLSTELTRIRAGFTAGTGIAISAGGVISSTAVSGTNVTTTTDALNGSQQALYITPNADQQRLFFGSTAKKFYALNFVNVTGLENMPGFKFNVGNLALGTDADATITRAGNVIKFNSSSTGTGTDNGYDFYGNSTAYSTLADGISPIMSLRTLNGGRLGINVTAPTEKLDVGGAVKISDGGYATIANNATTPVPTGAGGTLVFQSGHFYGWTGTAWKQLDN
jgi:hypothetical protein